MPNHHAQGQISVIMTKSLLARLDAHLKNHSLRSAFLRTLVAHHTGVFPRKGDEVGKEYQLRILKRHSAWQVEFLRSLGYDVTDSA